MLLEYQLAMLPDPNASGGNSRIYTREDVLLNVDKSGNVQPIGFPDSIHELTFTTKWRQCSVFDAFLVSSPA
jgi:hypothetical protein